MNWITHTERHDFISRPDTPLSGHSSGFMAIWETAEKCPYIAHALPIQCQPPQSFYRRISSGWLCRGHKCCFCAAQVVCYAPCGCVVCISHFHPDSTHNAQKQSTKLQANSEMCPFNSPLAYTQVYCIRYTERLDEVIAKKRSHSLNSDRTTSPSIKTNFGKNVSMVNHTNGSGTNMLWSYFNKAAAHWFGADESGEKMPPETVKSERKQMANECASRVMAPSRTVCVCLASECYVNDCHWAHTHTPTHTSTKESGKVNHSIE